MKEQILKEAEIEWGLKVGTKSKQREQTIALLQILSKAIDQTREETIKEVEWEIENWEIVDGKSFTSDKIKDILNKLKK